MNRKRIGLRTTRPTSADDADKWVETTTQQPEQAEQPKKKLIIELPHEMHSRFKSQCAERGVKMSDIVRDMINKAFPPV